MFSVSRRYHKEWFFDEEAILESSIKQSGSVCFDVQVLGIEMFSFDFEH